MNDDFALVRARLKRVRYSQLPALSKKTGIPAGTLARMKYGQVKRPSFDTVDALRNHFLSEAA